MGNKNKKILLTSALVMGSLLLSITLYRSNHQSNIIYGGQEGPSCEKYWSDSTYTSLNELNQMSSFYDTVTTWGTITDCYDNSAGGKSAFIQSKDAYGNVSGALLYNYGGQYLTPNTTLVEITGIPVWYFGHLRFTQTNSTFEVKSTDWYEPQTNYMTSSEWVDSGTNANPSDPLWQAAIPYGFRKTTLRNITIQNVYSNEASGIFNDGSGKRATFYFNDVSYTLKSSLYNRLYDAYYYDEAVDVTGYLQCFVNGGGSTRTMELQMCNPDNIVTANSDPISVTGVSLDITNETLNVGASIQLTATVYPNDATNKNVIWSSNHSNIASVVDGLITANQVGNAVISATTEDGNYQAQCTVTVTNNTIHVTGVSLNQNSLATFVDDTTQLIATVMPITATNKTVSWHSSNSSVVSVFNGLVTAISPGNATITVTTIDGSFSDLCYVTVEESSLLERVINTSAGFNYGSYDSNFGSVNYNSINYGYYRVTKDYSYGGFIALLHSTDAYDYNSLAGSFFNNTSISGIKQITVSYIASGGINISYGVTKDRGYSQTLAPNASSSWITTTISTVASNYFAIETKDSTAYINSVTIGYNNTLPNNTTTTPTDDYHIAPTRFSGALVDGVSSVTVPNNITIVGNTYTVNSTKTYTYYSYEYVSMYEDYLDLNAIAMTDPIDVANYYIAFHAIPANYGMAPSNQPPEPAGGRSEVQTTFGDDTRQITAYTRTDGYALSIPWRAQSGKTIPLYYEFDIALVSSYSTSNRGVGRLVMWVYGWTCYDDAPVAVFTDDHYATFSEYLNYGTFGARFDAEPNTLGYRTGRTNLDGSTQLILA